MRHRIFIVADDIANQYHLGQDTALGFGRVTDRAQISLVQVLQSGQDCAALLGFGIEEILDFNNRWNCITGLTKKLQANSAGLLRHLVQNPARRGDKTIASFFLDTRQTSQEFVCNVLAQAFFTEGTASNFQNFRLEDFSLLTFFTRVRPFQLEARDFDVMNLAQIMV